MLDLDSSRFPVLATDRLDLRALRPDDAPGIFELRNNREAAVFTQRPLFKALREAFDYIDRITHEVETGETMYWVATLRDSDALIGTACFWNIDPEAEEGEIGYEFLIPYQGHGFAYEMVEAVLEHGFSSIGFKRIVAVFSTLDNKRSIHLLEKCGFIAECNDVSTERNSAGTRDIGDEKDLFVFVLTPERFSEKAASRSASAS